MAVAFVGFNRRRRHCRAQLRFLVVARVDWQRRREFCHVSSQNSRASNFDTPTAPHFLQSATMHVNGILSRHYGDSRRCNCIVKFQSHQT